MVLEKQKENGAKTDVFHFSLSLSVCQYSPIASCITTHDKFKPVALLWDNSPRNPNWLESHVLWKKAAEILNQIIACNLTLKFGDMEGVCIHSLVDQACAGGGRCCVRNLIGYAILVGR